MEKEDEENINCLLEMLSSLDKRIAILRNRSSKVRDKIINVCIDLATQKGAVDAKDKNRMGA